MNAFKKFLNSSPNIFWTVGMTISIVGGITMMIGVWHVILLFGKH